MFSGGEGRGGGGGITLFWVDLKGEIHNFGASSWI